jgi:uncharacterized delta-60 repeat protein
MVYGLTWGRFRGAAAATAMVLLGLSLAVPGASAAGGSGSLDPTYGTGGVALIPGDNSFIGGATFAANGDLLIAEGSGVVAVRPDGTPDTSFGSGGFASTGLTNAGPGGVAVQSDGKIVWVGGGQIPGDTNTADTFAVARFTAAGTLDPTFGADGLVSTSFPAQPVSDAADTVLVQPDGKILVGGQAGISRRGILLFAAMLRLNADGSLDTSFGTGGKVVNTADDLAITALGLDAAGDIFTLPIPTEYDSTGHAKAAVVQAALTSTAHGGMIGSGVPSVFMPDGRGLVTGSGGGIGRCDADVEVQRFLGATPDPSFAVTPIDFSGTEGCTRDGARGIAVQADGKVLVVGSSFHGPNGFLLARLTAAGVLDSGFGTNGVVVSAIGANGQSLADTVLIQPDGKILVIGTATDAAGNGDLAVARYLP